MRISEDIAEAVKKAGVEVYYADRKTTKHWNSDRIKGEPCRFGGWYWMRSKGRKVIAMDEDGPFRCASAAIRDAYVKLQLR